MNLEEWMYENGYVPCTSEKVSWYKPLKKEYDLFKRMGEMVILNHGSV